MASQRHGSDRWPTILWIAWRAGEVEHQEPLCKDHRAYVFELYPASAHGLRRTADCCSMCLAHPPRTAQLRSPARRVSPTRHDPSFPRLGFERGGVAGKGDQS
jgi:hypothetical protein